MLAASGCLSVEGSVGFRLLAVWGGTGFKGFKVWSLGLMALSLTNRRGAESDAIISSVI